MCRPIREMTSARGFDIRSHVLSGVMLLRTCMINAKLFMRSVARILTVL
jgi:hypothetical protein